MTRYGYFLASVPDAAPPVFMSGFDEVYTGQVGGEQDGFFEFYAGQVLPRLREE